MDSTARVQAACAFQPPDRIPRFDSFWEYSADWQERFGPPETLSDVAIWVPEEGTFPTRARFLEEEAGWIYEVDPWGRTVRRKPGAFFVETLAVPLPEGVDPERVQFDPTDLAARYLQGQPDEERMQQQLARAKRQQCVFGKTGGPFLRTTFVRGEAQFLMDIASDPGLAGALSDKMGRHLAAVGAEQIRRWSLADTGIWIYDDMASNAGPLFRPASFEKIFLPVYRRMVRAYKEAGARYVFLHSDGDIRPLVDMLIEAGIDGLNPLERRAGMDPFALRRQYPRLILTGGMDNTDTLIHGPIARIQAEARALIDLGRAGGFIIGTHSISPEIPIEHFAAYVETCQDYGGNLSLMGLPIEKGAHEMSYPVPLSPVGAVPVTMRRQAPPGPGLADTPENWQAVDEQAALDPQETAVVLIDVWDRHWCVSATQGVAALVPGLNRFLEAARKLGLPVIFAPSDVVDFYQDYPQRLAALAVPPAAQPDPRPFDPPLPPWGITGGCECGPDRPCTYRMVWTRQHPDLFIAGDDLIVNCNDNRELWNLCRQRGLTHLVYAGVHANMCVSYTRSASIRQMVRLGLTCCLVRDLTAAVTGNGYDPDLERPDPSLTPSEATRQVVRHLERYFCPTVHSRDFLAAAGMVGVSP